MGNTHEIEIKLAIGGAKRAELLAHPLIQGTAHFQHLDAVYYDTPDWRLHEAGALLRTRSAGADPEQTLKIAGEAGGQIERGEWNRRIHGETPDVALFPAPARDLVEAILDGSKVEPFARVETDRQAYDLNYRDSKVELAVDQGTIIAGKRSEDICEVELELKQGRFTDLIDLVLELPIGPDLLWSTMSKSERGYLMAIGAKVSARKAEPVRLNKSMLAATAFQRIAWNCLNQLLSNYQLVVDDFDEEALHQSRVALRRLRAAFSIFKNVIADDHFPVLWAELKKVASALGPARDLDVMIGTLKLQAGTDENRNSTFNDLLFQFDRQRSKTYAKICKLLCGTPFQKLLFETAAWIESGSWLTTPDDEMARRAAVPIADFASCDLRGRRRKVAKAGHHLSSLDPTHRHKLRIKVKKLRYATDFFGSLFKSDKTAGRHKAFSSALGKLQDHLGELNDIVVRRKGNLVDLTFLQEADRARLTTALQCTLEVHAKSEDDLMRAADNALDKMLLVRHFWNKAT